MVARSTVVEHLTNIQRLGVQIQLNTKSQLLIGTIKLTWLAVETRSTVVEHLTNNPDIEGSNPDQHQESIVKW